MIVTGKNLLEMMGVSLTSYQGFEPSEILPQLYIKKLPEGSFEIPDSTRPVRTGPHKSGQIWKDVLSEVYYMVIGITHVKTLVVMVVAAHGKCIGMTREGLPGKNFYLEKLIFTQ